MSKFLAYRSWLLAFLIACYALPASAQPAPLVVGVLPTLSPRVLINNYQPFRLYLEKTLKRPVELVTATDFITFHHSTMAVDYDLIVTAAHLGRLAQTELGYLPLATYQSLNRALLVTSKIHSLKSIQDLNSQTVATLDSLALIAGQTRMWLHAQGIYEGPDYKLFEVSSHNSAGYAVLSGESALAIISPAGWKQMPANIRDGLQVYATLPAVPGLVWLASPHLAPELRRLKSAVLGFSTNLSEGKQFFELTGYQGMREITLQEMKSLDPYTHYLKKQLGP